MVGFLNDFASCSFLFGFDTVIMLIPHGTGEAQETIIALMENVSVRRLDTENLTTHVHQILGEVCQEDALDNLGLKAVFVVDIDGVGTGSKQRIIALAGGCFHGQRSVAALDIDNTVANLGFGKVGLTQEAVNKAILGFWASVILPTPDLSAMSLSVPGQRPSPARRWTAATR